MLVIVQGRLPAAHGFPDALVLGRERAHLVPWAGLRQLVAPLRALRGDAAVDAALAPRRGPLSLVLRGLAATLSPEERRARDALSGDALGRYPYPGIKYLPLADACAAFLADALGDRGATLVVPDVADLDPETMLSLGRLERRAGDRVRVRLGHGPGALPEDPHHRRAAQRNLAQLRELQARAGTTVETSPHAHAAEPPPPPAPDALDDGAELAAWRALDDLARGQGAAEDVRRRALAGLRAAYDAVGMSAGLALAEAILAAFPALPERAEVHYVAGTCAYNLVLGRGEDPLHAVSARHFEAALREASEGALDARQRASLLYRVSLAEARGRRFDRAIELAGRSVAEARALPPDVAPFYEAWARSGLAYPLFRTRRPDEAARECEAAVALLEAADRLALPRVDVVIARYHVVNNLARLADLRGERAAARRWQRLFDACEDALPFLERQNPGWTSTTLSDDDLAGAIARLERRYAESVREGHACNIAADGNGLVDLHGRAGDAAAAYRHAVEVHAVWRLTNELPEEVLAAEVNCALLALQAGALDEAEARLDALRRRPELAHPDARCELDAARIRRLALRGEADAVARAAAALGPLLGAVEDPGARLRAARSLGDALRLAGRRDEARATLRDALAAAGDDVAADDLLGALVSLREGGDGGDDDLVEAALLRVPEALESVTGWEHVPRLLPLVAALPALPDGDAARAALARLLQAGLQRADARDAARCLRARLATGTPAGG